MEILPRRKSMRLQRVDPDGNELPDLPPSVTFYQENEHVSKTYTSEHVMLQSAFVNNVLQGHNIM